jgi:hypothetical protein
MTNVTLTSVIGQATKEVLSSWFEQSCLVNSAKSHWVKSNLKYLENTIAAKDAEKPRTGKIKISESYLL